MQHRQELGRGLLCRDRTSGFSKRLVRFSFSSSLDACADRHASLVWIRDGQLLRRRPRYSPERNRPSSSSHASSFAARRARHHQRVETFSSCWLRATGAHRPAAIAVFFSRFRLSFFTYRSSLRRLQHREQRSSGGAYYTILCLGARRKKKGGFSRDKENRVGYTAFQTSSYLSIHADEGGQLRRRIELFSRKED